MASAGEGEGADSDPEAKLPDASLALAASIALSWVLCAVASFAAVTETDAGWHLALGRLILRGHFPHTNALSWTSPLLAWYPTSWLFDLLCALAAAALSSALGLQVVTFFFAAATAAALVFACAEEDRDLGVLVAPAALLLVLPRIAARPHLASWMVLVGTLALCLRARRTGPRPRMLALLLIALGGNLHSGAIFGAFVLGAFSLEAWLRDRRPADLALCFLAAPAALLVNPGGLFDLRYLFAHLRVDEVVRLQEFERPPLAHELAFFVLLPVAIALSLWRARKEPALLGCVLVFGGLALRTWRMVYEFELVAAPVLAYGLLLLRDRFGKRTQAVAIAALLGLCAAAHRNDLLGRIATQGPRWDEHQLPLRAAAFLAREHIDGPGFNGLRDGGYLEMVRPAVPAFIDGRVQAYPPSLFHALEDAEKTRAGFDAFLRGRGVEWALAIRIKERLGGFRLLEGNPGWALVYWDDTSEVFLRRDVPRFAAQIAALEYRHFAPVGAIVGGVAALPASELPALEAEVLRFEVTSPGDPFAALVRCALWSRLSRAGAKLVCDDAAARAPNDAVRALVAKARALAQ